MTLALPLGNEVAVRWAKMIVWYHDSRFAFSGLGSEVQVQATLWQGETKIWQRILTYEDSVVRCDLTKSMKQATNSSFRLIVEAPERTKQVTIEVIIEAQLLENGR